MHADGTPIRAGVWFRGRRRRTAHYLTRGTVQDGGRAYTCRRADRSMQARAPCWGSSPRMSPWLSRLICLPHADDAHQANYLNLTAHTAYMVADVRAASVRSVSMIHGRNRALTLHSPLHAPSPTPGASACRALSWTAQTTARVVWGMLPPFPTPAPDRCAVLMVIVRTCGPFIDNVRQERCYAEADARQGVASVEPAQWQYACQADCNHRSPT